LQFNHINVRIFMKILVCISYVPDTTTKINFKPDNKSIDISGVQFIINPNDEIALSKALELTADGTSGTVTVINVGSAATEAVIRKALATGANDAVRVNAEPADAFFTASQIASYATQHQFDLILTGSESIDYNGAQTGGMIAEILGIPSIEFAKSLSIKDQSATVEKEIEGGKETLTAPLPLLVCACEGMAEARIPNMRGIMSARTKPLMVIEAVDTSPATEIVFFEKPKARGQVHLIDASESEKLIELLHSEAKVI
jgi:electron transfer flavoprotein beta subunit